MRLFSAAHFVTTGRQHRLRFTIRWPCTDEIARGTDRLNALQSSG
ncbi:hypothetical protein [Streptomyces sp. NPDC127072]